ncbi:MAG: hypothetical protein JST89_21000 [Cyanobacteria bacterium SZAS-4]|nr:hypothetical protein [Cyanobacteria bacterium SZAS-4]
MTVYFVYRSHYETPTLNHLKKFDNGSVLEWFQQHWKQWALHVDDRAYERRLFGCDVYGFSSLFDSISDRGLAPPKSMKELQEYLTDYLYVEGDMRFGPDSIQVLTNDDELELAYYFFDDYYLKPSDGKTSFLLREEWRLPENFSSDSTRLKGECTSIAPAGGGSGTTYCAFLSYYDGANLTDTGGPICIDGIRLPNLIRYLHDSQPGVAANGISDWPFELRLMRALLPENVEHSSSADLERVLEQASRYPVAQITNAGDDGGFGTASLAQSKLDLEKLLKGGGGYVECDPPLIQVDEHVAQISLNTDSWDKVKLYQRWIFFDDLWAGDNVDLAESILCYANKWDVLT